MRIVMDLQGAQSSSRVRGMGRYSLSFAKAMVRNQGRHEVLLALNGLIPDTVEPIRADFDALLPQSHIKVWQAVLPVNHISQNTNWRRKTAELMREAFLANLKPDFIHISSLFEGLADDVVTSITLREQVIRTTVTLYDLIPVIYKEHYFTDPVARSWYEEKLGHLRRADFLLAISESSRQEAIEHLGFAPDNIINVSGAIEDHFKILSISSQDETNIRRRYGLKRAFVMYTGGIDFRKNIERLIWAYSQLPPSIRAYHQLAIVCSVQLHEKHRLKVLAKQHGLKKDELVLTGFVPEDDLVALYNLAKAFVFPSLHEGFGLPALEAMACGCAVIASNTTSLPEVIGRHDGLFDPFRENDIASKLVHVLTDDTFRQELETHGRTRATHFSWDETAKRAWSAFEAWHAPNTSTSVRVGLPSHRPTLAYISPLPPERSGISHYSVELLPALSHHYDIDVVVYQDSVRDAWTKAHCAILNVEEFKIRANQYDRVLYHFGNSSFHQHMFDLLDEIPGVIVLHDFFLSNVIAYMDERNLDPGGWSRALYHSHGYPALRKRYHGPEAADTVWTYPCNLQVLQNALGVIGHSNHTRQLMRHWYGEPAAEYCSVIPHLRCPVEPTDRLESRTALGLADDQFIICSFGLLGPTKLNHRLLSAWLESKLAKDEKCVLIFVGDNQCGPYGEHLQNAINKSESKNHIRITGWADSTTFQNYLLAADVAVQLRTLSRGESSRSVLDCMAHGLPTIVNAHASMAELPYNGVWKLSDVFETWELTYALETLRQDGHLRRNLGTTARSIILKQHNPRVCAEQYAEVIEAYYHQQRFSTHALVKAIAKLDERPKDASECLGLSECLSRNFPAGPAQQQLLVDVSELVQRDAGTGIQRVVRNILKEWLNQTPAGYRVEPVYATQEQGYRYARQFMKNFLDCPDGPDGPFVDELIEAYPGDIFIGLDLQPHVVVAHQSRYRWLRQEGIRVYFVVYDLLCLLIPQHFIDGGADLHQKWLSIVAEGDGAICISKAVADELHEWIEEHGPQRQRPFRISWFHLGADIESSHSTGSHAGNATEVLRVLSKRPTFSMIGTIEPRKGHSQTLEAFEHLWGQGVDVNLVIVGKAGWMVEKLIKKIQSHPELNQRLFWLEGISDEYLGEIYTSSACLIAASEGEGFGLPLIEAARHQLPLIVRDIPVFREVAGKYAFYFSGTEPHVLVEAVKEWLALYKKMEHPKSDAMPRLTWKESAERLMRLCIIEPLHNP